MTISRRTCLSPWWALFFFFPDTCQQACLGIVSVFSETELAPTLFFRKNLFVFLILRGENFVLSSDAAQRCFASRNPLQKFRPSLFCLIYRRSARDRTEMRELEESSRLCMLSNRSYWRQHFCMRIPDALFIFYYHTKRCESSTSRSANSSF